MRRAAFDHVGDGRLADVDARHLAQEQEPDRGLALQTVLGQANGDRGRRHQAFSRNHCRVTTGEGDEAGRGRAARPGCGIVKDKQITATAKDAQHIIIRKRLNPAYGQIQGIATTGKIYRLNAVHRTKRYIRNTAARDALEGKRVIATALGDP